MSQQVETTERDLGSHAHVALVQPRDPNVWTKDNSDRAKALKKEVTLYTTFWKNSNEYLRRNYIERKQRNMLRGNFHLTIGRERI